MVLACCSGVPAKSMPMVTTGIVSVMGCNPGLAEGAFDTSERTSGAGLGELEDVIVEGDKDTELSDVKMLEGDCV